MGDPSIGCYLGSFDPPHFGHVAIARTMLEEVDALMLLVPTYHFHKAPVFPSNATFMQRLGMLEAIREETGLRLQPGLTDVVLFLELDAALRRRFPSARILHAMGDETYGKVLDSASYYRRSGLAWTEQEDRALIELRGRCRVWNRSGRSAQAHPMDESLATISSTCIRERVAQLWRCGANDASWQRALAPLCSASVIETIRNLGLYVDSARSETG